MHTLALVIIALALLPLAIEVFFGIVLPVLKYISLGILIICGPILAIVYWKEVGQLILIIVSCAILFYGMEQLRASIKRSHRALSFIRFVSFCLAAFSFLFFCTFVHISLTDPLGFRVLFIGSFGLLFMGYFLWLAKYIRVNYMKKAEEEL